MTDSMEYNGWTNRETWALNLWLSNDQGLYEMTRERVGEAVSEYTAGYEQGDGMNLSDILPRIAGEAVKSLTEELLDPERQLMTPENIITILQDVGSLYRVNWDEIGASFLDSIEED